MIARNRGGLMAWLDRRAVTRMVGVPLPDGARDIQYVRWQPSGDLAYREALIRWDCTKDNHLNFVRSRGLTLFRESGPNVHLPTDWQPPPQIDIPEWWTPTRETPADAASGVTGAYGSIAVKWEAGRTFVMITDTGHRAR